LSAAVEERRAYARKHGFILAVIHDHDRGRSTVHEPADLEATLRRVGTLTPAAAATLLYAVETPDRNHIERARRRLNALTETGTAELRKDELGASYYVPKDNP
jgi:hypothetical protein